MVVADLPKGKGAGGRVRATSGTPLPNLRPHYRKTDMTDTPDMRQEPLTKYDAALALTEWALAVLDGSRDIDLPTADTVYGHTDFTAPLIYRDDDGSVRCVYGWQEPADGDTPDPVEVELRDIWITPNMKRQIRDALYTRYASSSF